ncbi:MAG: EFR1 family ferrodoxin, partial [Oscillospiraceae bacterium]
RYNEMRLHFGELLMMPDNSIITMPKPDDTKTALLNEERLVSEVLGILDEERQNEYPVEKFLGKTSKLQWASLKGVVGINDKRVDKKNCTDCEICINICPMKNIVRVGDKIKIGPNCTNCFACMHWCPTHSIKAGFIKVSSANQYTHPQVKASELFKNKK